MIFDGNPNRLYRFWWISSVAPKASMVLLHGARINPLVKSWSTIASIESNEFDSGRSVMKSMLIV